MNTETKRDGLLFKFRLLLTIFIFVSMLLIGFAVYKTQARTYRERSINDIKSISTELEAILSNDKDNLQNYLNWVRVHHDELSIPTDFDSWNGAKDAFDRAFAEKYPGKSFGREVRFDELTDDLKHLFATYYCEYTIILFEQFRESFNLPYTYFVVPTGNGDDCMYIVGAERFTETGPDGKERLMICDTVPESHTNNPIMWKVWETGRRIDSIDEFNNEYGVTISYYVPLYLNGEKAGIIGVDADIETVNRDMMYDTAPIMVGTLAILILCTFLLLRYIDITYISKLVDLQDNVKAYTETKNADIADKIEEEVEGKDEISVLSFQIADMIRELEKHMKSIVNINTELANQKIRTEMMKDLALTDSLTLLHNRYAYDEKVKDINFEITKGRPIEFAAIMVDLNFLKKLNDEYGHDKGDMALQRVGDYLKEIFGVGNSYRFGGDEFGVILTNNAQKAEELCNLFSAKLEKDTSETPWQHVSASIGWSNYNPETDQSFEAVAERADEMMYENKRRMKAERVD